MIKFNELLDNNSKNTGTIMKNFKVRGKKNVPWVDKYRPKKLADVVYQYDVVKMLNKVLEQGNLPHLLFYGPAGTGKTSTILAIAMELFGPKKYSERVIELNASDERGINIVRNKIVTIAKTSISSPDPNYTCPSYKIIILDEADAMTNEAQSALRKTLEDNSTITRFCFICNYINQIIDPIVSRCVTFRFKQISESSMFEKLDFIAKKENVNVNNEALKTICSISNGDMRKAIMILQNANYLEKNININDIYRLANVFSFDKLKTIVLICKDVNTTANKLQLIANKFKMSGFTINNILYNLMSIIIDDVDLDDMMKSKICFYISNTEKQINDGASEYLQLLSVLVCIKNIANNNGIEHDNKKLI